MSKKRLRSASAADKFLQTANTEPTEEVSSQQSNKKENITVNETKLDDPNIWTPDWTSERIGLNVDSNFTGENSTLTNNIVKNETNELSSTLPKIGQPKKYNEPTKHISFSFPISVIENLKILAGLKKTNQTQLILSLINTELNKEADKIEAYKKLLI